jgi:hypothetical protein
MIFAMRRLGRALLRSSLARRAAALTVLFGLVGANTAMVTTTVDAATHGPGLLGSLGLGGEQDQQGGDQAISIPQAACRLLPALCQPGTRLIEIPSGVVTLGRPATPPAPPAPRAQAPRHVRPHLAAPLTGSSCNPLTSLLGCSTATPSASATANTATTRTTTSASSPSSSSSPGSVSGSTGNCLLGLVCTGSGSTVSGTSTGSPTPTPAPTQGLCLLSCNVVNLGGNGCLASLLQTCVGQTSTTPPAGSGSGSGSTGSTGSSTGACLANLVCLLGSSCTAQLANTCLLGAVVPGLPGLSNGSPPGPSGPTGSSGGGSGPNGGSTSQGGSQPTGTTTPEGVVGLGITPAGPSQSSAAGGGSPAPLTSQPKGDESVGLVSGLSFGHGLILWPLFGLLDLAALAGLVVVVRRRWSATSS